MKHTLTLIFSAKINMSRESAQVQSCNKLRREFGLFPYGLQSHFAPIKTQETNHNYGW